MGFRFTGRRDGLLLAGFALALLTIFDQTLGQLLQLASDVEATYHVRLLPALVVLTVLLILHLHTRRQEMKVRAREAAAEARVAGERARDLELLASLGRALAGVLTEDALRAALWRHLPPLTGKDDLWVLLGDGPRVTLLLDTTGNPAVAVAAEEISTSPAGRVERRALDSRGARAVSLFRHLLGRTPAGRARRAGCRRLARRARRTPD